LESGSPLLPRDTFFLSLEPMVMNHVVGGGGGFNDNKEDGREGGIGCCGIITFITQIWLAVDQRQ
jgi:hypothetical protein